MVLGGCILFLGPPTSGKGTQSALVARKFAVPHVSLGEILRSHVQRGEEYAEPARAYLAAGIPVPVELMSRVLRSRLSAPDMRDGFIGDGLVRTAAQAQEFDAIMAALMIDLKIVFHINVSRDDIVDRAQIRIWCQRCGASYRRTPLTTAVPALCEADGEPLVHRADDPESIVEKRIRSHEETMPQIRNHYQPSGLLREIDGSRAVDLVHADILTACSSIV